MEDYTSDLDNDSVCAGGGGVLSKTSEMESGDEAADDIGEHLF